MFQDISSPLFCQPAFSYLLDAENGNGFQEAAHFFENVVQSNFASKSIKPSDKQ